MSAPWAQALEESFSTPLLVSGLDHSFDAKSNGFRVSANLATDFGCIHHPEGPLPSWGMVLHFLMEVL